MLTPGCTCIKCQAQFIERRLAPLLRQSACWLRMECITRSQAYGLYQPQKGGSHFTDRKRTCSAIEVRATFHFTKHMAAFFTRLIPTVC
jgi:hypothetical protein